ncbi:MAG: hypothetical protein R3301_03965 [Saprospiraceae bacterium]|nr:hypothetical protein [Saprospiraceae bacterium]
MKIDPSVKLKDIQAAFSQAFPFLRIEFYEESHVAGQGSPSGKQIDPEQTVGQVRASGKDGILIFDAGTQINAFEDTMRQHFGLNVQVFRKSGNLWLQTITTDNWTLEQADRKGDHSSELYREKYGD